MGQNRLQVIVLAKLSRIQQAQQNSAEITDIADIVDIAVKTGRQNIAKYGRIWQITINCRELRQSYDWSLVAKSVETGGCV